MGENIIGGSGSQLHIHGASRSVTFQEADLLGLSQHTRPH